MTNAVLWSKRDADGERWATCPHCGEVTGDRPAIPGAPTGQFIPGCKHFTGSDGVHALFTPYVRS